MGSGWAFEGVTVDAAAVVHASATIGTVTLPESIHVSPEAGACTKCPTFFTSSDTDAAENAVTMTVPSPFVVHAFAP